MSNHRVQEKRQQFKTIVLFSISVVLIHDVHSLACYIPIVPSWKSTVLNDTPGCFLRRSSRIALHQKSNRRRRRRKDESSSSQSEEEDGVDELPDFDITEVDFGTTNGSSSNTEGISTFSTLMGDAQESSSTTSMSSKNKPMKSLQELLADRSIESKFQFDIPTEASILPDLAPIRGSTPSFQRDDSPQVTTSNRKRERQAEARRLAAVAVEKELQELKVTAVLDKIPGIRDEKGNVSGIKILETGTWACIMTLIGWEIYINSPLFERAAPMAPIVY